MELLSATREAVVNLLNAKLRSFLAILGVLVGTASVVALMSSSQLATAHALAQFKKLGTNLLAVDIRDRQSGDDTHQSNDQFTLRDVSRLKTASPQIQLIAPYTVSFKQMYFNATQINGQIIGATEPFGEIAKVNIASGRFVSYLDERNLYCVIGATIAKKIQATGVNPLYQQIRVGDYMFTIVGVLDKWPENFFIYSDLNTSIIIPLKTTYLLSTHTEISNILVRLVKHPNLPLAKENIQTALQTILPHKVISLRSPEQLVKLVAKSRQTMSLLLIAIGSISLVVGGIGVMNIMLVSVIERRREIGIRMAVGARQFDILRMFLIESVVLTLFGGLLGVIVGVISSYIFSVITHWVFYFYMMPVMLGFIVSVIVGILSGFYPAYRASKLDPIQTLAT